MSFFEPSPPPESTPPESTPPESTPPESTPQRARSFGLSFGPWGGAPANVLAGVVPLRLVLATTETVAVGLTRLQAYRSGFSFLLTVLRRRVEAPESPGPIRSFRRLHNPIDSKGGIHAGFLRLGFLLADGTKVTNIHPPHDSALRALRGETPPAGPGLEIGSGHGNDSRYELEYWAWPLPPPGMLTLVCEWPSEQIPLTYREIDAQPILEAAGRAELLWGEEESEYGQSQSQSIFFTSTVTPDDTEADG